MALNHNDQYYLDLDAPTNRLISTVKIIAAYGCPAHGADQLCSCHHALGSLTKKGKQLLIKIHFTLEWDQHLVANDAAFAFQNTQNHAIFTHLTSTSPKEFARQFAQTIFAAPAMIAPASTIDATVDAMLAYWSDHAARWRSRYSNREVARARMQACQPGDEDVERYRDLSTPDPRYPPQLGKRLKLQRVRTGPEAAPDHWSTLYLMPLKPLYEDDIRYMLVGVKPCHENCSRWRLVLTPERFEAIVREMHSEQLEGAVMCARVPTN